MHKSPRGFSGMADNVHFFRHEDSSEFFESIRSLYKQFVSAIRDGNLKNLDIKTQLFPNEYSATLLSDKSLSVDCRLFASREKAENTVWKKYASILEIGVASGRHAVSLIQSTDATQYTGIDVDFSHSLSRQSWHLINFPQHVQSHFFKTIRIPYCKNFLIRVKGLTQYILMLIIGTTLFLQS